MHCFLKRLRCYAKAIDGIFIIKAPQDHFDWKRAQYDQRWNLERGLLYNLPLFFFLLHVVSTSLFYSSILDRRLEITG